MREISSREYANEVEDVICGHLERAVGSAWNEIAKAYGIPNSAETVENVMASFACGIGPAVRDSLIETFEFWGMDVRSDGRDY